MNDEDLIRHMATTRFPEGRLGRQTATMFLFGIVAVLSGLFVDAARGDIFVDATPLDGFLKESLTDSPGGMVVGLLDERGSRVFSAGKLDNGTDAKVNADTIFEIGSVTKVFTSLLALDMARRGEVGMDDPVARFLPPDVRMPSFDEREITLRNLAAQESGLPFHPDTIEKVLDWASGTPRLKEFKTACDAFTAADLYAFLGRHKLTNEPGARFQYSNVGMSLLGHALSLKAGESFEALVVNRIAEPLKMDSTGITVAPERKHRLAVGHWKDGAPSENVRFQVTASAGAMVSTVNDLLKFLAANLGFTQSELNPLLREMQIVRHTGDPKFGRTAMPWFDLGLYQPPGSDLLGHGGGGLGYLAFIGFDKVKRRGVVVLSNQMVVTPDGVGWTILQGMPLSRMNVAVMVREIVGLGLALDTDEATGLLRVTSVYPRSPAGKSGLTPGLIIRQINDVAVKGRSIKECLGMIGGEAGTEVVLEILEPGSTESKSLTLTRGKFVTASE